MICSNICGSTKRYRGVTSSPLEGLPLAGVDFIFDKGVNYLDTRFSIALILHAMYWLRVITSACVLNLIIIII